MAQLAVLRERRGCLLLFLDLKLERRRMRIQRKLALKSFGNPKRGRMVKNASSIFPIMYIFVYLSIISKEFEMILKRTLQNICLLTVHPNTTTSIVVQVVHDDGSLLPCAIHATCAALVDAGIPLKSLAVSLYCCLTESGHIILDPSKLEEQKMKAFVCLVFPSSAHSILSQGSEHAIAKSTDGKEIITSLIHGVMTVEDYFHCIEQGRAAITPLSNILKKKMKSQSASN